MYRFIGPDDSDHITVPENMVRWHPFISDHCTEAAIANLGMYPEGKVENR